MHLPPKLIVAPTLARMARIYEQSRSGGRNSPRFAAYLAEAEHHWGLASYNPMAGDAAAVAVSALLALDAELVAAAAAQGALEVCGWSQTITLAVVVATPGMWTDRLATEIRHRTVADRRDAHGEILLWAGDPPAVHTIERESVAEAVRTMWTSLHGPTFTLGAVLAREGLAYAIGRDSAPIGPPNPRVSEAVDVLGDTSSLGDIVAVLYGDAAAIALGYTPLGLPERAGCEWAIVRAAERIARMGAMQALRETPPQI